MSFKLNIYILWCNLGLIFIELNDTLDSGAEFVVPFFSGSRSLALKLSSKSHQMTPFFFQNEDWEQNDVILVKTLSVWKKMSFDEVLMMTWEHENTSQRKKEPQIPRLRCNKNHCSQLGDLFAKLSKLTKDN